MGTVHRVNNSSLSHTENKKKDFLVSGEDPTQGINDSTDVAEKNSINFSKANTKFRFSLHYNGHESYLYANKTEVYKFKAKDNISCYNFCWRSVSQDFTKDKQSEISLNGTVYDYSVDQISIKKEHILNIHQYLMIKNNIKWSLYLMCYSAL